MLPLSIHRKIDAVDITILMSVIYISLNSQGQQGLDKNTPGLVIMIPTLECPFFYWQGFVSSLASWSKFWIFDLIYRKGRQKSFQKLFCHTRLYLSVNVTYFLYEISGANGLVC